MTPETPDPPPVSLTEIEAIQTRFERSYPVGVTDIRHDGTPVYTQMGDPVADVGTLLAARAADALRHQQEIADLTAQERKRRDALLSGEACEAYRDVRTPCEVCGGWGVVTYGSTATWRGGIGGQAMTPGVCDRCWGSGDEHRRWPSWRETDHLRAKLSTAEATIQQQRQQLALFQQDDEGIAVGERLKRAWKDRDILRGRLEAAEATIQQHAEMDGVWLVMDGEYEASVASVHRTEASAKAWITATILDHLKSSHELDLRLADDAAERRELKRCHRTRVREVEGGDTSGFSYSVYREPVLNVVASTPEIPHE